MKLVYVPDREGNLREQVVSCSPSLTEQRDRAGCFAVLRRNRIGRLGFVRQDRPVLLPVTYAVPEDGTIVFRSARGAKLWVAENEQLEAAFEVDQRQPTGELLAVVVHGTLQPVVDLVQAQRLDRYGLEPWAPAAERDGRWIRLVPDRAEALLVSIS